MQYLQRKKNSKHIQDQTRNLAKDTTFMKYFYTFYNYKQPPGHAINYLYKLFFKVFIIQTWDDIHAICSQLAQVSFFSTVPITFQDHFSIGQWLLPNLNMLSITGEGRGEEEGIKQISSPNSELLGQVPQGQG